MLDILNSYKGRSGKTYESDYFAMDAGSWVVQSAKERNSKNSPVSPSESNTQIVQTAMRELHSPTCEIVENGVEVSFINKYGQGMPVNLKYKEYGFKEQFKNNLDKRGFVKIKTGVSNG
jgi:hypothetical protein